MTSIPRTEDGTLSSPGGAGSKIYDPQPIRDRPVGGVGDYLLTARGGINPGDIRVRSRVVGVVYMCGWIMIVGWVPIVPR